MPLKGQMTTLKGDDGAELGLYHVTPEGTPKGGLVLVMEIFGVTEHIKELCDGYAADGYEVVSPALYDRAHEDWQASYSDEDVARAVELAGKVGLKHTQGDVQACIDFLKARGREEIYITGYCYGGSVTWLAACRCDGLSAAAGYYGRLIMEMEDETPKCPTLLHFGEKDQSIPIDWVKKFKEKRNDVVVHIYDADHGFNSDRRQHYDPDAAALARERTLQWFDQH